MLNGIAAAARDRRAELTTLVLPDGARLAYADEGAGTPVLLVHGWAVHGGFFAPLRAALSPEFRVITPDLRGHGASDAAGATDIGTLAGDLHALITALDLRGVVALGWSMGALALWRMIERHGGERLAGLVIEDMSPRIINSGDWALGMLNGMDAAASARATRTMAAGWPAYAEAFAPRMFARGADGRNETLARWALSEIAAQDPQVMASLWTSMAQQDFRPLLPSVRIPVLIAYGGLSQAYGPETSRYLVETLPQAEAACFPRSGHAPHLEEPEGFAATVAGFARRAAATAAVTNNP
ncbi:MAG: alpha/beta hydrolase [Maricaulaceae bacterium]|nr:alpha/beta hydrolase [Maricaulaceae bacterium]